MASVVMVIGSLEASICAPTACQTRSGSIMGVEALEAMPFGR